MQNLDGTFLNDTFFFTLDYLRINVQSPLNNSVQDATGFWANASLSYISFPSGEYCEYEIDQNKKGLMVNSTLSATATESAGDYKNITSPDNRSIWYAGDRSHRHLK